MAEKAVLPSLTGRTDTKCVAQETFVNIQKPGGFTVPHFHSDDALGAIFYLDAPPGSTRLCYDDAEGTPQRERWEKYDPRMVRSPGRGYVEAVAGDLIIIPVG